MSPLNSTSINNASIVRPEFFVISGFAGIPHANYYYVFLSFVYAVSLLGNAFVMFMIYTDHRLHTPKYIVVFNLALSDLCGSTALVPQMLDTLLFKSHLISYTACLTHMFFVFWFLSVQSFILALLSYDRFVAICFPLRYNEIVTNKSMFVITTILWIFSGTATSIAVIFIDKISFCKSIVVNSFFCDHGAVQLLACDEHPPSAIINWTHPVTILWVPVFFITCTYVCIGRAIFKIADASERLKAMKTCTSHLILVSVFYLPICTTFAMGSAIELNAWIVNMSLTTVLPPMLNPIIYSLKTEEFTECIKKLYRRKKINFAVRNK
ncbi:olfactory receptor-like protein DTMT [Anguilla rostrata]|uniref:olfactory receptor-like protein DTMT n=1 Tax=Anguilla rostrata TaxID=7938 RepID=UPI0030CA5EDC